MRNKTRLGRILAVSTATVAAMAIAASSAAAYGTAFGNFSPNGTYVQAGTLTLTKAGEAPVTCQYSATFNSGYNASNQFDACSNGGTLNTGGSQFPFWNGGNPQVSFGTYSSQPYSPWGIMAASSFQVPVVNGNASTPTKLVLNNTRIGYSGGIPVYATGDLSMTMLDGSLVTVTP
jgi:hypothetical protein